MGDDQDTGDKDGQGVRRNPVPRDIQRVPRGGGRRGGLGVGIEVEQADGGRVIGADTDDHAFAPRGQGEGEAEQQEGEHKGVG